MSTLVTDGHYLLHRCLHVPSLRILSTKDGKPTGGAFGFIKSLRSTLWTWQEISRVVIVFDAGKSDRRMALYPEYKANRHHKDEPEELIPYPQKFAMNLSYLKFILPRLGCKVVAIPGKEGDDVVAMLCKVLADQLILVSSDDKDMYQLISKSVQLWRPMAEERVDLGNFKDMVGVSPEKFLLRKAILGDSSDNISGIEGVGEVTASTLMELCGDVNPPYYDKFFEFVKSQKGKRNQAIAANREVVMRNLDLVDMSREVFNEGDIDKAADTARAPSKFDLLAVKRMFENLEFYSLIEDFPRWITGFQLLK